MYIILMINSHVSGSCHSWIVAVQYSYIASYKVENHKFKASLIYMQFQYNVLVSCHTYFYLKYIVAIAIS